MSRARSTSPLRALALAVALLAGAARAADAPPEVAAAAAHARLSALIADGRLDEAEHGYRALLDADPSDLEAWLQLCRILRWTGRTLSAREAAGRASSLAPQRADARAELAWTWADAGLPGRAQDELGPSPQPPGDLRERLTALTRPSIALSSVLSDDTNGIARLASRLTATFALPADARLSIGAGWSRLSATPSLIDHRLVGAGLALPFARAALSADYVLHQGTGTLQHEGSAQLAVQIWDGYRIALGVRHRPLVEAAGSLATDEQAFYAAGAGGALQLDQVQWLSIDEARLQLQIAPVAALFSYADARVFATGDGNQAWSTAAGLGLNVVRLFGNAPVEAYLRWDAYFTGFAQQRATYFSPTFLDGQGPGADVRVHLGALTLGAEGGRTLALFTDAKGGWFGGGQASLSLGRLSAALRGQIREDPWYGSRRIWLSLRAGL